MPLGELPPERDWTQRTAWPHRQPPALGPRLMQAPPGSEPVVSQQLVTDAEHLQRELAWWTQQVPHHAPPFRALPLDKIGAAVLNAPSGSALGTAAATVLATANSMFQTVNVLPSVAVATNEPQTILSFTVPAGTRAVVRQWGAEVGDSAGDSVGFQLVVNGTPVTGEVNLADASSLDMLQEVIGLATERQLILVKARNRDTAAPVFVQARIVGWTYPCLQDDDSLRSSLSDSFGPRTNGRFGGYKACPPGTQEPCP